MTLDRLPVGARAVVREVRQGSSVALRLMEMGLVPGAPVVVLQRAPFGGPMQLDVGGYLLSIRRGEAAGFEVALVDAT